MIDLVSDDISMMFESFPCERHGRCEFRIKRLSSTMLPTEVCYYRDGGARIVDQNTSDYEVTCISCHCHRKFRVHGGCLLEELESHDE